MMNVEWGKNAFRVSTRKNNGYKISQALMKLYNSERGNEVREKMSESKKELYNSEKGDEIRKKMSESKKEYYENGGELSSSCFPKGNIPWNRGKVGTYHLSDEVKEKISKSNSGKSKSEEHKSKIKKWVNEHKEERSKAISKAKVKYLYRNIETGETHTRPEWREKGVTRGMLKGSKYEKILK